MKSAECPAQEMESAKRDAPQVRSAQDLWKRYHLDGDPNTEDALIRAYLTLVTSALARLAMTLPDHVSREDLRSAGLIGLLQAVRNFDPACGSSFESYARRRIRGAMLDELRRMDWVPRTIHEKARRVQDALWQLEQRIGGTPSEAQMARELNLPLDDYLALLDEIRPATFVCLDAAGTSDGDDTGSLSETVAHPDQESLLEEVSRHELKELVLERLGQLPEKQRKVLALYYGEDMHLREIAEAFGLTESRICQIHSQAILAIRSYLERVEAGTASRTEQLRSA